MPSSLAATIDSLHHANPITLPCGIVNSVPQNPLVLQSKVLITESPLPKRISFLSSSANVNAVTFDSFVNFDSV